MSSKDSPGGLANLAPQSLSLNDMRMQGLLCDIKLRLPDDRGFTRQAHAVVLATQSRYFLRRIQDVMQHDASMMVIDVYDTTAVSLDRILEFMYEEDLKNVDYSEVEDLLPLADRFAIIGLVHWCTQWLVDRLTAHNCVGVLIYAEQYNLHVLEQAARDHVLYTFEKSAETVEFLQIRPDTLESLLTDDYLNVSSEAFIVYAVKRWVAAKPATRRDSGAWMLKAVRFALLYNSEAMLVRNEIAKLDFPNAGSLLNEFSHEQSTSTAEELTPRQYNARPRIGRDVLFAVSGWSNGGPTNAIETYDCKSKRWLMCSTPDLQRRAYHGVAIINKQVFVIGGYDRQDCFRSTRCFDVETGLWSDGGLMHEKRCYVNIAQLGSTIYAMGGFNGLMRLRSVEKYDPQHKQWTLVQHMHRIRSDAGACALNGLIYCAGGFNGTEVTNTVECYNPATDTWTLIDSMAVQRSGLSLAGCGSKVYALGGYDGQQRLNRVECYDPTVRTWRECAPMITQRSNFATAVLGDQLYVVGGFNGERTVAEVERYDTQTNCWNRVEPMSIDRSAVKAIVVPAVSNAYNYSYHGHVVPRLIRRRTEGT